MPKSKEERRKEIDALIASSGLPENIKHAAGLMGNFIHEAICRDPRLVAVKLNDPGAYFQTIPLALAITAKVYDLESEAYYEQLKQNKPRT